MPALRAPKRKRGQPQTPDPSASTVSGSTMNSFSQSNPGTKYKSTPFIRMSEDGKKITLLLAGPKETDNNLVVKVAKVLKAAGNPDYCPTALCSLGYGSAPSWCHCPKLHQKGCVAHSFTYDEWLAVKEGPLEKRVVAPPPD